jgi:hypothetical protein
MTTIEKTQKQFLNKGFSTMIREFENEKELAVFEFESDVELFVLYFDTKGELQ